MPTGIKSGVKKQFGGLGKQIISELGKVPGQLTGLDAGVNETNVQQTGGATSQAFKNTKAQQRQQQAAQIAQMKQGDEANKQKQLAEIRRRLKEQMTVKTGQGEMSVRDKQEMEDMEKRKEDVKEQQEQAKEMLNLPKGKQKRGSAFVRKQKQQRSGIERKRAFKTQ